MIRAGERRKNRERPIGWGRKLGGLAAGREAAGGKTGWGGKLILQYDMMKEFIRIQY